MNPGDSGRRLPTVLLSDTAGAGKSIVAKEVHELLRLAGRPNAAIDLDAVGRTFPMADPPFNTQFVIANLWAMWPGYLALVLDYLVLARVVLSRDELDGLRALPGIDLRVVLLQVDAGEVERRLQQREPGVSQGFLLRIAPEIAAALAAEQLEDFTVDNGPTRSVTEVAVDILQRLDWPVPTL